MENIFYEINHIEDVLTLSHLPSMIEREMFETDTIFISYLHFNDCKIKIDLTFEEDILRDEELLFNLSINSKENPNRFVCYYQMSMSMNIDNILKQIFDLDELFSTIKTWSESYIGDNTNEDIVQLKRLLKDIHSPFIVSFKEIKKNLEMLININHIFIKSLHIYLYNNELTSVFELDDFFSSIHFKEKITLIYEWNKKNDCFIQTNGNFNFKKIIDLKTEITSLNQLKLEIAYALEDKEKLDNSFIYIGNNKIHLGKS